MECPFCQNELIEGTLKLRSGAKTRVLFSPQKIKDGFIEKQLPGSLFDTKLKDGEIEIMKLTFDKNKRIDKLKSSFCSNCGMIFTKTRY